jgi:fructosamine-3-kinase
MHRAHPASCGLDRDNYVGRLPQDNEPVSDWPTFYRLRRLAPLAERAFDAGLITSDDLRTFDTLYDRLPELVGPPEPPARLHGDFWGGNLHATPDGRPCLIDPAAYGGHREIDLAMMRLFGGFDARTFAAYDDAYPLAAGHEERVSLYQLYPLLVHVSLFGAGYVSGVRRALERYL